MESRDLVDVTEAARLTGLAKATLYKLAHAGRLRSYRVLDRALRFERADVLALTTERSAVGKSTNR
jgi:excisionase family DNA binding protein